MSYYAVVFYEPGNPEGMPTSMARDAIELGDSMPLLPDHVALTAQEWAEHVAAHQAEWDAATLGARLLAAKVRRATELSDGTRERILASFNDDTQRTLTFMHGEAIALGLANRRAHIESAWTWVFATIGCYYAAKAAVEAATTPEAALAVVADYTPAGAAPAVSIGSAKAITD